MWSNPPLAWRHSFERGFAGVTEGRMAEVVRQRQRLREILVEPEGTRDRARDLLHLERMREPCAVMVAFVEDEDLRLVLEPAEGGGMDDPVAIAPEVVARGARRLRMQPSAALGRDRGVRGARAGIDSHFPVKALN